MLTFKFDHQLSRSHSVSELSGSAEGDDTSFLSNLKEKVKGKDNLNQIVSGMLLEDDQIEQSSEMDATLVLPQTKVVT